MRGGGALSAVALLLLVLAGLRVETLGLPALCSIDAGAAGQRVICSCHGDQDLELAAIAQWLPAATTELRVTDCRQAAVEVKGSGAVFSSLFLQRITFCDIKTLTFYKDGLDMNLAHDGVFILDIERVETLQLTRGSLRLSGAASAIVLRDAALPQLPQYAIVASSLKVLQMTGVTLLNGALPLAVSAGSAGTVLHMQEVDTGRGLHRAWLTGQVEAIALVRCRLTLHQGAFSKLAFTKTSLLKTISIQGNIFQPDNDTHSLILPNELLSLATSETILASLAANVVVCGHDVPFNLPATNVGNAFYNSSRCTDPSLSLTSPQHRSERENLEGSLNTAAIGQQTGEYVISVG